MRFYQQRHRSYCDIDLHARSMFIHVVDEQGQTRFEPDRPAGPTAFLDAVQPFRDGLVVGCECMFAWYWLADLCEDESIPFTLGHALYMKALHGGKSVDAILEYVELFIARDRASPRDRRRRPLALGSHERRAADHQRLTSRAEVP